MGGFFFFDLLEFGWVEGGVSCYIEGEDWVVGMWVLEKGFIFEWNIIFYW